METTTIVTPSKIKKMTDLNQLNGVGLTEFETVFETLDQIRHQHGIGHPIVTKSILMDLLDKNQISKSDYTAVDNLITEIAGTEKFFADERATFINTELARTEHLIPTLGMSSVTLSLTDVADYLDDGFIEHDQALFLLKVLNRKKTDDTPSISAADLDVLREHKAISDDDFEDMTSIFGIIESHEGSLGNRNLAKNEIVLTKDNLTVLIKTAHITDEQHTKYLGYIAGINSFYRVLDYNENRSDSKPMKTININ